jgi:hypothetical protein
VAHQSSDGRSLEMSAECAQQDGRNQVRAACLPSWFLRTPLRWSQLGLGMETSLGIRSNQGVGGKSRNKSFRWFESLRPSQGEIVSGPFVVEARNSSQLSGTWRQRFFPETRLLFSFRETSARLRAQVSGSRERWKVAASAEMAETGFAWWWLESCRVSDTVVALY